MDSILDSFFKKENQFNASKEKWNLTELKNLCDDFKSDIVDGPFGSNLKKKDYISEGIPVLKIQNVKTFQIINKKMSYVSNDKYEDLKRHNFIKDDIVMTKLGDPLGVSAKVQDIKEGLIVADLVRVRAKKVNTDFLCYQLNSSHVRRFLNSQQRGIGRKRIKLSVVRELPIAFPSEGLQLEIVSKLNIARKNTNKLKLNYESKKENLLQLKSAILSKELNNNSSSAA